MRDALGASCKVFSHQQGLEGVPLLCSLNIIVSRRPAGLSEPLSLHGKGHGEGRNAGALIWSLL